MTEMSPLRRRMIEDMTVRNLSPATQRSQYVHAVAKVRPLLRLLTSSFGGLRGDKQDGCRRPIQMAAQVNSIRLQ
jgi:hypothetical protein